MCWNYLFTILLMYAVIFKGKTLRNEKQEAISMTHALVQAHLIWTDHV